MLRLLADDVARYLMVSHCIGEDRTEAADYLPRQRCGSPLVLIEKQVIAEGSDGCRRQLGKFTAAEERADVIGEMLSVLHYRRALQPVSLPLPDPGLARLGNRDALTRRSMDTCSTSPSTLIRQASASFFFANVFRHHFLFWSA